MDSGQPAGTTFAPPRLRFAFFVLEHVPRPTEIVCEISGGSRSLMASSMGPRIQKWDPLEGCNSHPNALFDGGAWVMRTLAALFALRQSIASGAAGARRHLCFKQQFPVALDVFGSDKALHWRPLSLGRVRLWSPTAGELGADPPGTWTVSDGG